MPAYPIAVERDGTVIEPIDHYLRDRILWKGASVGTACDEAHILADWWASAHRPDNREHPVDMGFIARWINPELEDARSDRRNRRRGEARAKRRLLVVQSFLRHSAGRLNNVQIELKSRVESGVFLARVDPLWADRTRHIRTGGIPARTNVGRSTPTDSEVERVLQRLSRDLPYEGFRDYLCASWMREVGLRRSGVASLQLSHLASALVGAGLDKALAGRLRRLSYVERTEIRRGLAALSVQGTEHLEIFLSEKGGPRLAAAVPLTLIETTLEFVWGEREKFVRLLKNRATSDHLWLSRKTARGLRSASIGDLIKRAFNDCDVKGSGHRLRAAFAERVMLAAYLDARHRDPQGIFVTDEDVLLVVAERLRHASTRSLRPYLNRVRRFWRSLQEMRDADEAMAFPVDKPSSSENIAT